MNRIQLLAPCALLIVSLGQASAQTSSYGSGGSTYPNGVANPNSHPVGGYVRSNGTYVAPSQATNPNSTKSDNYSTKGNVNPYTGKTGTRN